MLEAQAVGAVVGDVEQVGEDHVDKARLAVGGESHHLVLAIVDPKPQVLGERRVEQAQAVGEADLVEEGEPASFAHADGVGRPLADAVGGERGGPLKRREEEGARGVGLVVRGVDHPLLAEVLGEVPLEPELVGEPAGDGVGPGAEPLRRDAHHRVEHAPELEHRLLVEGDQVEVARRETGLREAGVDRVPGVAGVVLDPCEPLLLGGSHHASIHQQCGGTIVVEGGDSQDVHALRPTSRDFLARRRGASMAPECCVRRAREERPSASSSCPGRP